MGYVVDVRIWEWEFLDPGRRPDVSIVICVHGNLRMTLACLDALRQTQFVNPARTELVLVDDASIDGTLDVVSNIRGLRVHALSSNVGFLRAANEGAELARGEHILMLNNDTEPVGRWLDPLLEVFDRRPRALVVGSQLVYPDGTLQEAGGIIFRDGSGWNYGRGLSPSDPRVMYERQVDYVSGAALLVRGDFFRQRGGFDEQYAPAYYEDTDLCFAAREAGGEVWYQPASIVVHHEGQSHGTDDSVGVKAHQPINREKFEKRWSHALVQQWEPDAGNVPCARERSTNGRILIVDHQVPTPDHDSGSVRLTAIMKAMLDLGFSVSFLPLNGWRREPHTRQIERMGVEVLGVLDEWWQHVGEMARAIRYVWISRPNVADEVLKRLRSTLPESVIVYDTVDLHFLRLEREALASGDVQRRIEAAEQEIQELELIHQADAAVVVSPYEQDLLSARIDAPVVLVPNVHRDHEPVTTPAGRLDLVFVGGFGHRPNVDAVVWFVEEILPLVHREAPDTRVTVIGSYPTPEVLGLESDRVKVEGWVPETLPYYQSARIAIAPLRYGAGVKGKVGEAMSLGVPMVMTSMASEGMHIEHGIHALVADDALGFAANILSLLNDDDLWLDISRNGQQLIHDRFGVEATRSLVAQALEAGKMAKDSSWA